MTIQSGGFQEYLAEEIKKYGGIMIPVKAGLMERLLVKEVEIEKLHPNPDDEFCMPGIGPNDRIISDYMARYHQYGPMKDPDSYEGDPLIVEKVHPDGYMILNGHHRWAAFWKLGVKKAPVSIVNLTQKSDIEEILRVSEHDRRVTLDLDEVAFCQGDEPREELIKGFPEEKFKERLRPGIPALLQYLSREGYDIWVYTAGYYSLDYLRYCFKHYSIRVTGIVTGMARKAPSGTDTRKEMEALLNSKYKTSVHIDNDTVIRTDPASASFDEYRLSGDGSAWSREVMKIFEDWKKKGR